ncbi:type II toxin-antitoxin system HipA family toxin [Paucibacter sp. R3-3]|uniref:Type II toxin-antitoxin system HipA family toxin n=1 Tax=Roseateles agri TaxID=3098619 RepID=A0ABU5DHA8_9BURK|nr:type II toxin-antitoxin system HipA family toxin [Paucibacter sp. R3-3]MDY0745671.1 type II toxin-antitoxin system HipA family toxin [Paucibacter sp. R3-3]
MATASPKKSGRPAPYRAVEAIEVLYQGQKVGAAALDKSLGFYAFQYYPQWLRNSIELAPLQMPVRAGGSPFVFTDIPEGTYRRLPALLADALPDKFGNALVNRYMADRGIRTEAITALDRLAYLGNRAMGALEFRPARGLSTRKPTAINLAELVSTARAAVHGQLDSDDETHQALRNIIEVGTSAGGARAKAVIAINPETHDMVSGQLAAPPGFQHWLLKFDGVGKDEALGTPGNYGRIEFAHYLMARAAGIEMTECQLLEENDRAHFMTRRFDRFDGNGKHHVQSLCAMAHLDFNSIGTNAYSQLFLTMRALDLPYLQFEEAFRRMAFNVMARNCDDHSKNFAFILRTGEPWALSPAYDITFAHDPNSYWTKQHLMSVNGKSDGFEIGDLIAEAERFGIGTARDVIAQVSSAIAEWPSFAADAGVPESIVATITSKQIRF